MVIVKSWSSVFSAKWNDLQTGAVSRKHVKAMRYALRDAGRALKSGARAAVVERSTLKKGVAGRRLRAVKQVAGVGVVAAGKMVPIGRYKHRQNKGGVTVTFGSVAPTMSIRSAFDALIPAGKRKFGGVKYRGVFLRRGRKRLPIDEQWGPSVAEILSAHGVDKTVVEAAEKVYAQTYRRVLGT